VPRVAILHYTTSPCVGGIETLIDCQSRALSSLGCSVRWITGVGHCRLPVETVEIPLLLPAHPEVQAALQHLPSAPPSANHPLVKSLAGQIRTALDGSDECWVHNALTLYINPFLTAALRQLIRERPTFRWVVWCHDLSVNHPNAFPDTLPMLTYVTLSHARRLQLSRFLSVPERRIQVIPPAIDPDWLGLSAETKRMAACFQFDAADLLVVVPAKLLPHKNLRLAVQVAASLRDLVSHPLVLLTAGHSPHHPPCSASIRHEIEQLLKELDLCNVVHFLSGADESHPDAQTLRDLFRLCDLVLLPSIDEGFGMPLWEAAALRVPVLCSDIPAFREVGGDSVSYFTLNADRCSIARQALAIARSPQNQARHRALYSFRTFQLQIQHLLNRTDKVD
jgi:mannosylglucosylglycerate synthase